MIHFKKCMKGIKKKSSVKNKLLNKMVKSHQKFPNVGGGKKKSKISQVQNLGTVPKLYLVINNDGFPFGARDPNNCLRSLD